MTRRMVLALAVWPLRAAEPWKSKRPEAWTAADRERILTDSPWAKTAKIGSIEEAWRRVRSSSGAGQAAASRQAGQPNSGIDPWYRPADGRWQNAPVLVRWESAAPVRSADGRPLPAAFADYYVVGVWGLDPGAKGAAQIAARIESKGNGATPAASIASGEQRGGLFALFPRSPMLPTDSSLTFVMTVNEVELKVRFNPKEMMFDGKPAL